MQLCVPLRNCQIVGDNRVGRDWSDNCDAENLAQEAGDPFPPGSMATQ